MESGNHTGSEFVKQRPNFVSHFKSHPDGTMLTNEFDFVIMEHSGLLGVVTEAHAMARGPQGPLGEFSGIVVVKRLY